MTQISESESNEKRLRKAYREFFGVPLNNFKLFFARESSNDPYTVIGSFSVQYYGEERLTKKFFATVGENGFWQDFRFESI